MAQIKAKGVIRVGLAVDPPFSLQQPNGSWYSFNPTILTMMAGDLGVTLDIIPTTFAVIVAGLIANKYDMIGASLAATPDRAKVIDFTCPYAFGGTDWIVQKSNTKGLKTVQDLNSPNVTIAFLTGTDDAQKTMTLMPLAHYRAIPANLAIQLSELTTGRSDAAAVASFLVPGLLQAHPEWYTIPAWDPSSGQIPQGVLPTGVVWGVNKGNSDLQGYLNGFIQTITANGTIARLSTADMTIANSQ